jgi:hypothetical protein
METVTGSLDASPSSSHILFPRVELGYKMTIAFPVGCISLTRTGAMAGKSMETISRLHVTQVSA